MTLRGGCLCGAIRYELTDNEPNSLVACHCSQCRRASGHYLAAIRAPRAALSVAGDVSWYQSSPVARRGFCATCGSNLFWDSGEERISIMAGSLDAPTGLRLSGHIFVADKGDYYAIGDGLPQSASGRTDATG